MSNAPVHFVTDGSVAIITLDRRHARNAVDGPTARLLADAFRRFETDDALHVAVLTGANGTFCAGADLKAIAAGNDRRSSYEQWDLSMADALAYETRVGLLTLQSAETRAGAERFVAGEGRHGA